MLTRYFPFLIVIYLFWGCNIDYPHSSLFSLVSPQESGLFFENKIEEGPNTNVLMYEYFYNGAGVALADFNGDELLDIYVTSNMGDSKMFLNKGDFKFEDITTISKTSGRSGPWKTGVTAVDINGDKRMDLYVCYSGMVEKNKRKNQLFLNMGNNTDGIPLFTEAAGLFGLDSPSYSNQGYFFDYDKDGDLDMLLLNHNPKSLPILGIEKTKSLLKEDDFLTGLRLFEQHNRHFNDITSSTKINGSSLSYGLGIAFSDYNNDGWTDFYVCNDYTIPDYLYINNQNGGFTNELKERIGHTSHFSMGNDSGDFNNDGWTDLITLDMLPEDNERQKLLQAPDNYNLFDLNIKNGFHYQFMRNMLQKNNGDGTFSEIGQIAGISNTDWSWSSLFADFDNDGWQDLFISNGYKRDYTNRDFLNYMEKFVSEKKSALKREDVLEIINQMPASDVSNYIFKNQDGNNFKNVTKDWGLQAFVNSNGAAYGDLDNDGDLDLVINNINSILGVYRNNTNSKETSLQVELRGESQNSIGIGAKVKLYANGIVQTKEQFSTRGYLSSVSPILHFGLGNINKIDSIQVYWPSGKYQVFKEIKGGQKIILNEEMGQPIAHLKKNQEKYFNSYEAPISYQHTVKNILDFDRQRLLHYQPSFTGPILEKGDLNNDQYEDLIIGGGLNEPVQIWLQNKNGTFNKKNNPILEKEAESVVMDLVIFDWDLDGDLDFYQANGGYHSFNKSSPELKDILFLNDGTGTFIKHSSETDKTSVTNSIAIHDVNGDGFNDLFIAGGIIPGDYPNRYPNRLLINENGKWRESNDIIPQINEHDGIIRDVLWEDVNLDDQKDLILVGEWMPITVYLFKEGKYILEKDFFNSNLTESGWWNTITTSDVNGDGKADFILGNEGLNNPFKPSFTKPIEIHFGDFDSNGTVDPIISYYIGNQSFPLASRDELLSQWVEIKSKYPSYEAFAKAEIQTILNEIPSEKITRYKAQQLESVIILSNSEGYSIQKLPKEVQTSPITSITVDDFNQDGNQDLLLLGNRTHLALKLGRNDANPGYLLTGNGQGEFTLVPQPLNGLKIRGDVSSVVKINSTLFIAQTNQFLKTYSINE